MRRSLAEKARAKLRELKQSEATQCTSPPSLLDFFEREAACGLDRPHWLIPYTEKLQVAIGGDLRIAFAAPPQHGKSETTLRAFLYWARYFPGYRHAYVTYNDQRTKEVAKEFRRIAVESGFTVGGNLDITELGGGTRVKFTSIQGGLTGYAVDGVCIIDDPIKGPKEARSGTNRADCVGFWRQVARSRRHHGTSYVAMATRWHLEDLPGHLVAHEGFEYINLKAIADPENDNDRDADGRVLSDPLHRFPGEALWPERKPPEFFTEERRDVWTWAAQYQGQPRPDGGEIFGAPTHYTELPGEYRVGYGIDLASTAKTRADFSVSVEGWATRHKGEDGKPFTKLYIVDVKRKQVEATSFLLTLHAQQSTRRGAMRWYFAGGEKAGGQFIKQKVPTLEMRPASVDKVIRSRPAAAAWNSGQILVPPDGDGAPSWLAPFLEELRSFTGQGDSHDDQVDALAALWDVLAAGKREVRIITAERELW